MTIPEKFQDDKEPVSRIVEEKREKIKDVGGIATLKAVESVKCDFGFSRVELFQSDEEDSTYFLDFISGLNQITLDQNDLNEIVDHISEINMFNIVDYSLLDSHDVEFVLKNVN